MTLRRKARELALQFLYGIEVNPGDLEEKLASFWQMNRTEREIEEFAASLIRGVVQHKEQIDRTIWDIQRIIPVDRNMLRLAVYELAFRPDIPHVVTINEAVDIAKKFGTAESGKFVNGILDNVRAKLAEA
jgi:N utilization substance protein B